MKTSSLNTTEEQNNKESNSKELIEKRQIPETPFTAIRIEDKWFLTLGKYRLTNPVDSYEAIEADAQNTSWDRLLQIMKIVVMDELEQRDKIKSN